ncbi:MAG: glycoside hydrolase family 18 protein [Rikenellaceae bacterium]
MKKILKRLSLFALAILTLGCASGHKNYADNSEFIHATYTVANRMKGHNYAKAANYQEFQFVYFFAQPRWSVEDFDMSQEQINHKYVEAWDYSMQHGCGYVNELITNIHTNPDAKILCSFQGREFSQIASDEARRVKFANMMAQFVVKHDYDGIELDWEHTITLDEHILFMEDIRGALNALQLDKPLYLTTALHTTHIYTQEQADALSAQVDWINLMTYDIGGGNWGTTATHNTPLTSMRNTLKDWEVFSPKKICIGLASYGFQYHNIMPGVELPEGELLNKYGRYCSAYEMPDLIEKEGWIEQWDDKEQAPYFFSPDSTSFITIDTARSLALKIDWIKEAGYKGAFWWEFHTDWYAPADDQERGRHLLMDDVTRLIDTKIRNIDTKN